MRRRTLAYKIFKKTKKSIFSLTLMRGRLKKYFIVREIQFCVEWYVFRPAYAILDFKKRKNA